MDNVINKLKEIQKKVNMIKNNIDEMNERKSFEENKQLNSNCLNISNRENTIYSYNLINNNSNSHKNIKNSSNFNYYKTNNSYNRYKKSINYEKITKFDNNCFPICENNIYENNGNDIYTSKRNKNNQNRRAISHSMNININHNLNNNKKKNKIKDYFYLKKLKDNKKNYCLKSQNNKKKPSNSNIKSFSIRNNNIKINNYFNTKTNKNLLNNPNNYNKKNFKKDENKHIIFSEKSHILENKEKNLDTSNNKLLNNNEILSYKNSLYNHYKSNNKINEKINKRNNNSRGPNKINSDYKNLVKNFDKNKSYYLLENSNFKTQRNISFHIKKSRNIDMNYFYDNEYRYNIEKPINNIKDKFVDKSDNNYKQIVLDIIDITNEYNKRESKANIDNIIDEYKSLLLKTKTKDKFILRLFNKYNKLNKTNLNHNDPKSLQLILNWINQKINFNNNYRNNEEREYIYFCHHLMKQYKLNDIQQLKNFIDKLYIRNNNSNNFLEGIKKLLSS